MNKNDSDTEEEDREADRHNNFDEIEKALRECGRKLWIDFTEQAQTSKFWIELLALVILGVYTTFSALQWYEMRIATEKAGISAEAAQGQLGILQKQLEALDRPWVSIDMSVASPLTYGITSGIQVNFNLFLKISESPQPKMCG